MAVEGTFLAHAAIYLGAAVVAVPLFKRLGLGSVLGYLAAGAVIGPFGLALIGDADSVLHFAEFGVVLLLFVIGLDLKPARLWAMRRAIFGLGLAQMLLCGGALMGVALLLGFGVGQAIIVGFGLALSSTAFALQMLEEKGELNSTYGNTSFAVLLFQDLCIVPLLAAVSLLSPTANGGGAALWLDIAKVVAVILAVVLAGRYLLRPVLRLIAVTRASEIFTAAALLLVVGTALIMQWVGLSMALGAFLAGLLLAESEYRHQLETDIEPFRGLLLGLFFIAVGMSVDWRVVLSNLWLLLAGAIGLMAIKGVLIYGLCRLFRVPGSDAQRVAVTLPQSSEFAFVLFSTALAAGLMPSDTVNLLMALVTLSMAGTPLVVGLHQAVRRRMARRGEAEVADVSQAQPQRVIIAGFGRVGQVVSQLMAARGIPVTALDHDPKRIEIAKRYCNTVYFADVRRADVLATAGAGEARLIFLCVDDPDACIEAIRHVRAAFPQLEIVTRAYDRDHVLRLLKEDVDCFVRETFESSIAMGKEGLRRLDVDPGVVDDIESEFRRRDDERFRIQQAEGQYAGVEQVFTRYGVGE